MLYEPEGYDATRWPDSYWRASCAALPRCPQLQGEARADVVIIGAGYAGLNAALELNDQHGADVVVLEAGQPGWGASGRNGGFCCLGGARLPDAAIRRGFGAAAVAEWAEYERAAIARVRDNLVRYSIDAQVTEPGELLLADSPRAWAQMQVAPLAKGARLLDRAALRAEGLQTGAYLGGLYIPDGFGLHPYAYVTGLARAALAAGVRIHGDSRALSLAKAVDGWRITTAQGVLQARQVLVATNGYSDEVLLTWLKGRILPAISNIMVTRPLSETELEAQGWTRTLMAYDKRMLLHYFRLLPDNRLMFGARGGLSFSPASVAEFAMRARAEFDLIFPALAQVEAEYHWNGLVCLTASRAPYIGPVPRAEGLFCALGWHGNGVAAASEGGRRAARMLMGQPSAPPAITRRAPPRFLVPRKWALGTGMAVAGLIEGQMRAVSA
ncbi:MAG: FAD-binding oxidoreductase [Natronohydrobacter sp.]|nr:FAD-binding oxidoreductase [Natronohydrobacter sp.]